MSSFILQRQTQIKYQGTSKGITYFINILKRDMDEVLLNEVSKEENHIQLTLIENHPNLQEDQFECTIDKDVITITGTNERGIIYGLLHLSEKYLGVDRFWFWNDQKPPSKQAIQIAPTTFQSDIPTVRYRGWFVNDEVLLSHWNFGDSDEEKWERIFETLLRCKGNMVIPGTDLVDPTAKKLASKMGLMLTHHHAEPLGAEMFNRVYPDKEPSFTENRDGFIALWRKAIEEQKDQEIIWNIGFRGQGDRPFWADDPKFSTDEARGKLIGEIIQIQYDLISEYQSNPNCCVNLYGEITDLYKKGHLVIPENVIKVWADSGYGKMVSRRQGSQNPRILSKSIEGSKGLEGIYYHVTFYDLQASNHLTMFPNTPEFIQKELSDSFKVNMNEFLIVNCGNIRPHQYFLSFVSELWHDVNFDRDTFKQQYFEANFFDYKKDVQRIFEKYQDAIVQYGDFSDERAGEQFYYYAIRNISHAWLARKTDGYNRLDWLTGKQNLSTQVKTIQKIIQPSIKKWDKLLHEVTALMDLETEVGKRLFNQVYLPIMIHQRGINALNDLCDSYQAAETEDFLTSFMEISHAANKIERITGDLNTATHAKWQGFYDNDCLTNISLAGEILETVQKNIRLIGDGPNYYIWEKAHIDDKSESSVMLLTNKTKQLSNKELYQKLLEKL